MQDQMMTERLPVVRISPTLKTRLDRIVANGITPRLSDHVRFALEQYVESEEAKAGKPADLTSRIN